MARPAHDCFRCCPSEAWPQGCCAPLTNLGFDAPEGEAGPAVAVKVSNAPEPDPLVVKSLGRPKPAVSGGSDYVMAMMEAREAAGTLVRITNSRAVAGSSVSVDIGQSHSWWQWDESSQMWRRFQHYRPPPSAADKRSPEAVSTGVGDAWVMTGRDYIHGAGLSPFESAGGCSGGDGRLQPAVRRHRRRPRRPWD